MDNLVGMNHLIISLLTLKMVIICVSSLWFENSTSHYLSTLQDLCNDLKKIWFGQGWSHKTCFKNNWTLGLPTPKLRIDMEMLKEIPLHFLILVTICLSPTKNWVFSQLISLVMHSYQPWLQSQG
jgi:hypothetical protein